MRRGGFNSIAELAKKAGVQRSTLDRFYHGKTSRLYASTRKALLPHIPSLFQTEPLTYAEFLEAHKRFLEANGFVEALPLKRRAK
jgi:AcrR family transcriptional regulator